MAGRDDRSDEAIAAPGQGLDELRRFGRIPECLAGLLDRRVQAVLEVHERVGFPEPFAQLLARADLARPFEQQRQDLSRLLLQPDPMALPVQLAAATIEFEWPEMERVEPILGCPWERIARKA